MWLEINGVPSCKYSFFDVTIRTRSLKTIRQLLRHHAKFLSKCLEENTLLRCTYVSKADVAPTLKLLKEFYPELNVRLRRGRCPSLSE